jgi:hypothetical protein
MRMGDLKGQMNYYHVGDLHDRSGQTKSWEGGKNHALHGSIFNSEVELDVPAPMCSE